MVAPEQTLAGPLIAAGTGKGFTETGNFVIACPQLLETIYFIVSTPPVSPVTIPSDTVASLSSALHVPPGSEASKVMLAPEQTLDGPDITPASGIASMVSNSDTVVEPHKLETK
jgi:hypothetical protein